MPDIQPGGLLALDLARKTGWAYGVPGAPPVFGSRTFGDPGISLGPLMVKFADWLDVKLGQCQPSYVAYEMFFANRKDNRAAKLHFALHGQVARACHLRGLPCNEVSQGDWRKHFLGRAKGRGKTRAARRADLKALSVLACKARGWDVGDDDDKADGLGIWDYGCAAFLGAQTPAPLMVAAR